MAEKRWHTFQTSSNPAKARPYEIILRPWVASIFIAGAMFFWSIPKGWWHSATSDRTCSWRAVCWL